MIAVDTSALMAVILNEPQAGACIDVLRAEGDLLISAATVAEARIVALRRGVVEEMAALIDGLGFRVIDVTPASARRVSDVYARWGKGVHRAGLNFGDCFAYEVAQENACPLLYVGEDFAQTDLKSALTA
jgi:Uncharacterized protein conserved in bacteria